MIGKLSQTAWLHAIGFLLFPMAAAPAQTPSTSPLPVLQSDPLPTGAERRLGTNRLRLGGPVEYFMFSPDDATLMVGSGADAKVHFWETKSWRETWRTDTQAFSCSPDGKHIAKQTGERTLEIWDTAKKALVRARDLSPHGRNLRIFDIEFNASGEALWVGVSNKGAWLYNWDKDKIVHQIAAPDVVESSLTHSRDRKSIVLRHSNRVCVYDGATGKVIREVKSGLRNQSTWQALNHDGKILATLDQRGAIAFWDVPTGKAQSLFSDDLRKALGLTPAQVELFGPPNMPGPPITPPGYEFSYHFDAKGAYLLAATTKLVVVDLAKKKIVASAPLGHTSPTALAVSNDNKTVAIGFGDGVVQIRELPTLKPVVDDPYPRGTALGIAFARDGQSLATFHDDKAAVRLWNLRDGRVARTFDIDFPNDFPEAFSLAFLPGERCLALGTRYRWDLATGERERLPDRKDRLVAASADGNRWLLLKENEEQNAKEILLHDAASGRELAKLPLRSMADAAVPGYSVRAALSADAGWIALHSSLVQNRDPNTGEIRTLDDSIVVWNAQGPQPAPAFSLSFESGSTTMALSPDGRFLSLQGAPSQSPNQLWHMPTGFLLWKGAREGVVGNFNRQRIPLGALEFDFAGVEWPADFANAAFSPDAQFLADTGEKGIIVREALSGAILMTLAGQDGRIAALSFSSDGRSLASASSDSTVMLWKVPPFAAAKPGTWQRDRADALWTNLRGNAAAAYQAMADLHAGGDEAVAILKDKLRPETDEERRLIQQALAELGAPQFFAREKATARLEKWGFRVKPHLAEALAKTGDLEQKRRLTALLHRYKNVGIDPDELRLGRSVFLLERIGTPGARVVLEGLARGHADDLTAQSARGALVRLKRT
jgi:WD40 repeat protein